MNFTINNDYTYNLFFIMRFNILILIEILINIIKINSQEKQKKKKSNIIIDMICWFYFLFLNTHLLQPSPNVADHPLGPATDHRLGKLLPHQLANQARAPPRADSSFYSLAYGVLAAVSSYCSPPKGRFLHVTHPSATGNTTSRPTCMC